MSIQVTDGHTVALYDDTEGVAFGPTFESFDLAQDYLRWVNAEIPARKLVEVAGGYSATDLRHWPAEIHRKMFEAWFDARVDAESGQLKAAARV